MAMLSDRLGVLLKNARQQLNLSRVEVARRGHVSTRLVAESGGDLWLFNLP